VFCALANVCWLLQRLTSDLQAARPPSEGSTCFVALQPHTASTKIVLGCCDLDQDPPTVTIGAAWISSCRNRYCTPSMWNSKNSAPGPTEPASCSHTIRRHTSGCSLLLTMHLCCVCRRQTAASRGCKGVDTPPSYMTSPPGRTGSRV
jgi:hypothetical protein